MPVICSLALHFAIQAYGVSFLFQAVAGYESTSMETLQVFSLTVNLAWPHLYVALFYKRDWLKLLQVKL